jgi:hypothetical protein
LVRPMSSSIQYDCPSTCSFLKILKQESSTLYSFIFFFTSRNHFVCTCGCSRKEQVLIKLLFFAGLGNLDGCYLVKPL